MEILQGEEREEEAILLFKRIIVENFSNLGKKLDLQVHVAYRTPYLCVKRLSLRHSIIKLSKVNDKEF